MPEIKKTSEISKEYTFDLEGPHPKGPLTTAFGRFIERASYVDLMLAVFFVISSSSAYFMLAPVGHSLNIGDINLSDSIYFSFVTFTSLGYGDLTPQGFGRIVAIVVVMLGLAFVALLVGKIASERQQAILLLLHTSDCQRRLSIFSEQLYLANEQLRSAGEQSEGKTLKSTSQHLASTIEAVSNYLIFNANQARLVEFGNKSSLFSLYYQIERIQKTCVEIHKSENRDKNQDHIVSARMLAIANRNLALIRLMDLFHRKASENKSYSAAVLESFKFRIRRNNPATASSFSMRVTSLKTRMEDTSRLIYEWRRSNDTPAITEAVRKIVPSGTPDSWGRGLHKIVAAELDISNTLAQKCLNKLLKSGKLPKKS